MEASQPDPLDQPLRSQRAPGKSRRIREAFLSLLLLALVTMWIGAPVTYVILKWDQGPLFAIVEGILAFGGLNLLDPLILKIEEQTPWVRKSYSRLEAWWHAQRWPKAPRVLGTPVTKRLWSFISVGGLISLLLLTLVDPSLPQAIHTLITGMLPQPCADGICVSVDHGQKIGISSGHDYFWTQGPAQVTAEQRIYDENRKVFSHPDGFQYYEMVIVTTLTEKARHTGAGHDDLRGILLLQRRANDYPDNCLQGPHGCRQLVVLVANAGDNMEYAPIVAQQILRVARANPLTFIGVTGWPVSTTPGIAGLRVLTDAHIPVVSSTASSDALSAFSPYFFRVIPPDSEQGPVGARYAQRVYSARRVAIVFFDRKNPYSLTLASAFIGEFTKQRGNQALLEEYDGDVPATQRIATIGDDLQDAFLDHRKVLESPRQAFIYFAGYSEDFSKLLNVMQTYQQKYSQLPVLSGDSAYDKMDFNAGPAGPVYKNFAFTAFAHPNEWNGTGKPLDIRAFFSNYRQVFYPGSQGADPPEADTMLSYDAAAILFYAALTAGVSNGQHIQRSLAGFNQCEPFQGVSGSIAFAPDGNPIQKAILVLTVDANGMVTFLPRSIQQGQLLSSQHQC